MSNTLRFCSILYIRIGGYFLEPSCKITSDALLLNLLKNGIVALLACFALSRERLKVRELIMPMNGIVSNQLTTYCFQVNDDESQVDAGPMRKQHDFLILMDKPSLLFSHIAYMKQML